MEPIGVISGIAQIVTTVYFISKELYDFVDGIKNAPQHVLAIAQDVRSLYLVLGSLQGLLADLHQDRLPSNVLPILESLQQPLNHCLSAFRHLQEQISRHTKPVGDGRVEMRKWKAFRWQFTDKDANIWREHLLSYKLTLDVAIATANLVNTSQNVQATQTLEQQMHAMRFQIDEMRRAEVASNTQCSIEPENGSQITDRFFALNRFMEATETIFSGSPPPSPSASPDILPAVEESAPILPPMHNTAEECSYGKLVMRRALDGHCGWVWDVALSPDGTLMASVSNDMTTRIWDVDTGSMFSILEGHSGWVRAVAFAPNGKLVASASDDTTVRLWDVTRGATYRTLAGHSNWVRAVAFSPDGRLVASASKDKTIRLWDVGTGSMLRILEGHSSWVRAVVFAPNGKLVASASDDTTVRLWDTSRDAACRILAGHSNWVRAVAFSPDGRLVASASKDKTVRLWDVTTGSTYRILAGHSSWVRSVVFSLDGNTIASASDDMTVRLWDAATGSICRIVKGHSGWVRDVTFSADGKLVMTTSEDTTVSLWGMDT